MRPRRAYPDKQESASSARSRLMMLLVNCSDNALAAFTAEYLAKTHRVPMRDCWAALNDERARRAAR